MKSSSTFGKSSRIHSWHSLPILITGLVTGIFAAPPVPTLTAPAQNATAISLSPNLTWTASTGATSYHVQVSSDSNFTTTVVDDSAVVGTTRAVTGLLNSTVYYWHVSAKDSTNSAYSTRRNFTTIPVAPGIPVLTSPANSSVNLPLTDTLTWGAVSGAVTYRVQVSTDSLFATTVLNDSTVATNLRVVTLTSNTHYYWRVNAKNTGGTSAFSTRWDFTIILTVPNAPVLTSPANNAINRPLSDTLRWNTSTNATSYQVQFSTDSTFATTLVDDSTITTPTVKAVTLTNSTVYYWHVRAKNASGNGAYSTRRTFTGVPVAPGIPVLTSPADGAINQPLTDTLRWGAVTGAVTYRVQLSTDSTFATTVLNDSTVATNLRAFTLSSGFNYYWRVNAKNGGGTSAFSTRWAFGAILATPAAPTLSSPANNAINRPLSDTLKWNASVSAATYHVQFSTDSTFATTIIDDSTLTGLVQPVTLTNSTVYYWHVNAKNATGTSAYSTRRTFTGVPVAPGVPVLTSPVDGAVNQPLTDTLRWGAVTGAVTYRVQLSTDSTFATTVLNDSTVATTLRAVTLTNGSVYYWRVNAKNGGGTSAYSTRWGFTAILVTPTAPTLSSPANNATNRPLSDTLRWNASAGAASYRVQLSSDSTFATTLVDDSTVTTTLRPVALANGTVYYWHVNAKNAAGTSAYSTRRVFTSVPAAPPAPVLSSPASGATGLPLTDTLKWAASTGAVTYRVQVSSDSTFATTVLNDSAVATTQRVVTLSSNVLYYWRVNAKNTGGTSAYSTIWNFTTLLTAPAVPALTSPANNAVNVPLSDSLTWAASANASGYHVQLSSDSAFATLLVNDSTVTGTSRTFSGLSNSTVYYWHVNAGNVAGTSAYSARRSFTTVSATAPATPVLSSPANNAVSQPLLDTLKWVASTGASSYRVQLSSDSLFATTVVDDSAVTGTSRAVTGLSNSTVYYWRVNAKNPVGTSAFSASFNFTTVALAAPATPVLSSPANNATAQPLVDTLKWAASTGAVTYRVQLSSDSLFATTLLNDSTVTGTSRAATGLSGNTVYYWRVNAKNSSGTSAYSTRFKFTTLATVPVAPVLSLPPNNAKNLPLGDTLVWAASPGAATYHVQLSYDTLFLGGLIVPTSMDDTTITGTTRVTGPLAAGLVYYWRVNAKNTAGTSPYSALRTFSTALTIPTPFAPVNNATGLTLTDTLQWTTSNDANTYRVQLSTDSTFATTLVNDSTLTAGSRIVGPLAYSTRYYWRVSAKNTIGVSGYSSLRSFTTTATPPPSAPVLNSPANNATNMPLVDTLKWTASTGAATYRVQLSSDSAFATLLLNDSTVTATSRVATGLLNNTVYYWRVNAKNSVGTSAYSTRFKFTTTLTAPSLSTPANNATNLPLTDTLTWTAVPGATGYRLQIASDSLFATLIVNDTNVTTTSRIVAGFKLNTVYYWRINARNAGGTGAYSTRFKFTTTTVTSLIPGEFTLQGMGLGNGGSLRFTLAHRTHVKISLLDSRGELKQLLFNGARDAGSYSVPVPVAQFRGGFYILDFRTDEFHKTAKVHF